MAQEDQDAGKLDEPEEILGMILIPGHEAPEVLQPGVEPFDAPAAPVPSQRTPVLDRRLPPTPPVRRDQFHPALRRQARIQRVAVIRLLRDQSGGELGREAVVERGLDQRDFVGRSTRDTDGEGRPAPSATAMILVPLPRLVFPTQPPLFSPPRRCHR